MNGDGIDDAGEPGLPGVTIELLDGTGAVITTAITDASGRYRFDGLVDGSYTIRVDHITLPASHTGPTGDPDGTLDGMTVVIVAGPGALDFADFGYEPAPTTGSVEALVYDDTNGDGAQNNAEPGRPAA